MITPQSGGVPLYAQLADILRRDIQAGRLQPGQILPSERSLQQQHNVGRGTVRRAIAQLRAEGALVVLLGHGVRVKETTALEDLVPPAGAVAVARMPSNQERAELGLDDGVPLIEITTPDGVVSVYPADRWQLRWPSK